MTPAQVRALSVSEYIAFLAFMDREQRELARANRKRQKGR